MEKKILAAALVLVLVFAATLISMSHTVKAEAEATVIAEDDGNQQPLDTCRDDAKKHAESSCDQWQGGMFVRCFNTEYNRYYKACTAGAIPETGGPVYC